MLAHGLPTGAALGGGDEAVAVGVEAGEGLFGAGLDVGDRDGTAGLHPGHAALTGAGAPMGAHRTGTAIGAGFPAGLAGGVEFGAADGAVVIGVQPFEAGVGATGHPGLHRGAALIRRDGAVTVAVHGRQALNALSDELGLAEAAVAVGVGAHRPGRRLLSHGDAGRGQHEGGQTADQKGLVHFVDLHGRQGGRNPCLESETQLPSVSVAGRRQGCFKGRPGGGPYIVQTDLQGLEIRQSRSLGETAAEAFGFLIRVRLVVEGGA